MKKGNCTIINWDEFYYSNLMCYELTDIEYRYKLRGCIDCLIVPELNKDTNYFSNIVESTTRDLHVFVIQVNTSKYGDSRITGPYNSFYKDIIKIKGGEGNNILSGTLDILELNKNRDDYYKELMGNKNFNGTDKKRPKETKQLKKPSAGYKKGDNHNVKQ